MADPINSVNVNNIGIERYKKLTPQEILKKRDEGENVPPEIIAWAQDIIAYSNIPDDVTYESVDGEVGIEALNQLGIPSDEQVEPTEPDNDIPGEDNPDDIPEPPNPEQPDGDTSILTEPEDDNNTLENDITLADNSIVADNEEIRRRKARKGIIQ